MDSTSQLTHLAPADQPHSVHQIADRLFPAYTVDNGCVHLAGCTLEDRLFIRLEFRHAGQPLQVYVDADAAPVPSELVEALGMTELCELPRPPGPFEPDVERLIRAASRLAAQQCSPGGPPQLLAAAALWCKFAEGKLRFEVGPCSVDLPFADWSRTLRPPPFHCPHTSLSTFHLAATDDGRMVAAQRIEVCEETGRRVLTTDLQTCSATGCRALPELIHTCPVTGQRVLKKVMVACVTCQQAVSPNAIRQGQCAACRALRPVAKADPRMARLLDEHPPLDRWRSWKISETSTVYILAATGWFNRLLVVADKDSLELKVVATGNRFSAGWNLVEPSRYDYVLRE